MNEKLPTLDELRDIRDRFREETDKASRRVDRTKTSKGKNIATKEMVKAIKKERKVDDTLQKQAREKFKKTFLNVPPEEIKKYEKRSKELNQND